jgi:hypothetical protein
MPEALFGLLADIGEDTAVDVEHMTVHSVGSVRSEEHGGASQF